MYVFKNFILVHLVSTHIIALNENTQSNQTDSSSKIIFFILNGLCAVQIRIRYLQVSVRLGTKANGTLDANIHLLFTMDILWRDHR